MRGSRMLSKTRRVVCDHYSKVVGVTNSGNFQFTSQTSQSQVFTFPTSDRRFDTVFAFDSENSEDGDINESGSSLREICDERLKRCAQSRGSASSVSVPRIGPSWQCGRIEFRSWISTGNQESSQLQKFEESPDDLNKRESDADGSRTVGRGGSRKSEKGGEGLQKVERREKTYPTPVESTGSECEGGLGSHSEEDWGNVPKKAVKKNVILKMCKIVRASTGSKLSACGEANVRVLLALGANEQQVVTVFRQHPKLQSEVVAPFLLRSARLFHDFAIGAHMLLKVIVKLCRTGNRTNMLIRSTTNGHKQVLTFLRDEIGVKELGKVVTAQPTLLAHSIQVVQDNVSTLESLGVVVDSAFVEKFSSVLLINSESLRKRAQALDLALGPGIYVKQPILLNVSRESVPKRVANLKAVVGEALPVRELLVKNPSILIAREETVRETWCNLIEMFGKEEVVRRVRSSPHILACNWQTLHPKLEVLKSERFSRGDMLTCLHNIAFLSLDGTIKPRIEIAFQSGRLQAGSIRLSTLLCNTSKFNKIFGIKLL